MVKIPKPVLQALHILQSRGIQAEIFPMYGTERIHFVITLPDVEIKEIDANPKSEQTK
jgi:hypothetical protein